MLMLDMDRLSKEVADHNVFRGFGKLQSATGLLWSCALPASVGDQCLVYADPDPIRAEVISFARGVAHLVPYDAVGEIRAGMLVARCEGGLNAPVGDVLLGRVLDGLGRPIDERGPLPPCATRPLRLNMPAPMRRHRINRVFITGQRALDGLLTLGWGQRVGIFAGSGVGKSTLLGEIAKGSNAEVNVIALIGERGREVVPFLEDCVGPAGMKKSVAVVATCDQTPLMRVRAAQLALTIADYYREMGAHVLLMLDSLTRLAIAQRELGLALGEPPTARGFTPSVFQLLANIIEAMGNAEEGSMTGILTVLVDGNDFDEPIADAVRSLVDGHVNLDRHLAERGHYPAINVARSISRVANEVTTPEVQANARKLRAMMATYEEAEDLLRIGAYVKGTSTLIDRAVELRPTVLAFLQQHMNEFTSYEETLAALGRIAAAWQF